MSKTVQLEENPEKLKICILSPNPPMYGGGTIQAFRMAFKLKEIGAQPMMVFSLRSGNEKQLPCYGKPFEENLRAAGIPVYKKPDKIVGKWAGYKFYIKLFWRLRHEYQLVYINGISEVLAWFIPLFKLLGKRVIVKMTGLGFNDPAALQQRYHYNWLKFKLLGLADRHIGTSTALCEAYRHSKLLPKDKLVQIPNGVDTTVFAPQPDKNKKQELKKKLKLPLGDKIVTYVGAIKREKGIDLLLNSWRQVIKQYPNATLLLLGPICLACHRRNPEAKEFIDSLKENIGLCLFEDNNALRVLLLTKSANKIQVLGIQENVNEYLQASDVFVFPSRKEGMPNALMEAMASGLACVTLDIGEITGDLITSEELGYTVAEENVEVLTQAVVGLLKDETKCAKIGRAARRKMEKEYALEKIARQHYTLYQQLCG